MVFFLQRKIFYPKVICTVLFFIFIAFFSQANAQEQKEKTVYQGDVFDLFLSREKRDKLSQEEITLKPFKLYISTFPFIGYNPALGLVIGGVFNPAIYLGEVRSTPISAFAITFNYTSVYSFESGLLRGFKIGGSYQGAWKRGVFYYYPDTIARGPSNRALFRWPTQCTFQGIAGYDWKWRRTKVSTQINVSNLFNHYRIMIIPALNGGYSAATGLDATFLDQPRAYTVSTRISF